MLTKHNIKDIYEKKVENESWDREKITRKSSIGTY